MDSSEHYNVLFLMSDQHSARCLGNAGNTGNTEVRTPALDRLAAEGTAFTRAFAQNPICTPSRTSFLSGQYCHNHGYYGLSDPRRPGPPGPRHLPSLMSHFRTHGYRTAVIGKTHTPADWLEPHVDTLRDCMGFIGPDGYGNYLAELGLAGRRDDRILPEHLARRGLGHGQGLDARPSALPLEHSVEAWVEREASRFIAANAGTPWVAWVSFPRPHQAWTPAEEFWNAYDEQSLTLPPSADDPLTGKPPHHAAIRQAKGIDGDWYFEPADYEHGRRRVLRGYYALVSQTDHYIGRLLARLADLGLDRRTLVIYSADHGDFAGEHGIIEKAPGISYDAITRVPFIWRLPGVIGAGRVCDELVESVDLLPTVIRLTGLPDLTSTDGLDITPLLRGDDAGPLRDAVFTECPWAKCVRTKDWKLVDYPREFFPDSDVEVGELYQVSQDPWEMTNLFGQPGYEDVTSQLRRTLWDWLVTTTRVRTTLPDAHGDWAARHLFDGESVPPSAIRDLIARGARDYL